MSLFNAANTTPSSDFAASPIAPGVTGQGSGHDRSQRNESGGFVDRRREGASQAGSERRQFGSSHDGLSDAGRELALAIDQYKLEHHRRYITCDEMLWVITNLGYTKS